MTYQKEFPINCTRVVEIVVPIDINNLLIDLLLRLLIRLRTSAPKVSPHRVVKVLQVYNNWLVLEFALDHVRDSRLSATRTSANLIRNM